jgi:predicted NBD/HSP70 family sugar kinase
MKEYWGIDLGGTKIECAVITYEKNENTSNTFEVLHRERIPTESSKGYDHVINQVKKLVDNVELKMGYRPENMGIGTPGAIEPKTGLMKNSNSVCLNGQPFEKDLEKILGIQLKMVNDANCFAMAEAQLGIVQELGSGIDNVFGVIMGTGVGGGIIINGQALNGKHGIAGEWGHNFLDESGGDCYCGRVGCTETIIAGPSLERYYESISGEKRPLKEIVERHRNNSDQFASKTMDRLTSKFGEGIAKIINVLDPQVIVIGGGVGKSKEACI